jgi:hypothetical protein
MAGCGVHFRFAPALRCDDAPAAEDEPRADDSAHSTCGQTAAGEACRYTTPVVVSANSFDARVILLLRFH